jgi:hypothetical protein
MRAAAGVVSAAILFAPGCGGGGSGNRPAPDPVRRAAFRSLVARDFLFGCSGGAGRAETRRQAERMGELYRFGIAKGAGQSLALAENDWAALKPHDTAPPCAAGEGPYRAALATFAGRLDALAAGIRVYPQ